MSNFDYHKHNTIKTLQKYFQNLWINYIYIYNYTWNNNNFIWNNNNNNNKPVVFI